MAEQPRQQSPSRRKGDGTNRWALFSLVPILCLPALMVMVAKSGPPLVVQDPGVRSGPPGAGGPVPGLNGPPLSAFQLGQSGFEQVSVVVGTPGGLGPRFNSNQCSSCHAQPAVGGASPAANPLFAVYQLDGAQNTMPSFETATGAALVPRFPFLSDLVTPDGTVHQLFTITGRSDAGSCNIQQPDFVTAGQQNNLQFRQPISTFGDGFVELVQSSAIIAGMNSNLSQKLLLGISGHPNIMEDGSPGRFGWKAQNRSLFFTTAQEYQIEEGVTNDIFPNELDETPGCVLNPVPESTFNYATTNNELFSGDPQRFMNFMRFLNPAVPGACPGGKQSSCTNGQTQFKTIGCVYCHTTSFTTPLTSFPGLPSQKTINLYSDLLVHHMGPGLADSISQGTAAGDEFRTAPLWGLGQRIFFMHDGRTQNLIQAIQDHSSVANSQYPDSEANAVVNAYNALSAQNQQDLLNFLRSL